MRQRLQRQSASQNARPGCPAAGPRGTNGEVCGERIWDGTILVAKVNRWTTDLTVNKSELAAQRTPGKAIQAIDSDLFRRDSTSASPAPVLGACQKRSPPRPGRKAYEGKEGRFPARWAVAS
jgi:hypothetical protein